MDDINDEDVIEWGYPGDEKVVPIEHIPIGTFLHSAKKGELVTVRLKFPSSYGDLEAMPDDDMPESNDDICRAPLRLVKREE